MKFLLDLLAFQALPSKVLAVSREKLRSLFGRRRSHDDLKDKIEIPGVSPQVSEPESRECRNHSGNIPESWNRERIPSLQMYSIASAGSTADLNSVEEGRIKRQIEIEQTSQ
nr:hypothetical protein CFP56_09873 [Quercus suber]